MTKTICDVCGKDMPPRMLLEPIKNYNLCISSYGKTWDMCDECRSELNKWVKERKSEKEDTDAVINRHT